MSSSQLITVTKLALRITTDVFDQQILLLIDAALVDLGIAGVVVPEKISPIVTQAVITYVRMNFGAPEEYDLLKRSYDEQKAQLATATGFTRWEG
jgi:hypothetical protein